MAIVFENNKVYRNLQEQVEKNKEDIETLKNGIKISRWLTESQLPEYITEEHVGEFVIVTRNGEDHLYVITKRLNGGLIADDLGKYPAGIPGEQGIQGIQGETGPQGTGIYTSGLPLKDVGSFKEGDMLLVIVEPELGNIYKKVNGAWVPQTNIKGPQGPIGPKGPAVYANPIDSATDNLTKIKIDGITYTIEGLSPEEKNALSHIRYSSDGVLETDIGISVDGDSKIIGQLDVDDSINASAVNVSTTDDIVFSEDGKTLAETLNDQAATFEKLWNKKTSISAASTNADYPTAKAVYDYVLSEKGIPNGVAPLNSEGIISSTYLPSYVDDVIDILKFQSGSTEVVRTEVLKEANLGKLIYCNSSVSSAPPYAKKLLMNTDGTVGGLQVTTPEAGKIYVNTGNGNTYRWSGSDLVEISKSIGLNSSRSSGSSSTAYRSDYGVQNYNDIIALQTNKQDKLTAGDNITIEYDSTTGNTIINATSGGGGGGKYAHFIETSLSWEGAPKIMIMVITNSNTEFTASTFAQWLYNNGYNSTSDLFKTFVNSYPATNISGGQFDNYYPIGAFSTSGTSIRIIYNKSSIAVVDSQITGSVSEYTSNARSTVFSDKVIAI